VSLRGRSLASAGLALATLLAVGGCSSSTGSTGSGSPPAQSAGAQAASPPVQSATGSAPSTAPSAARPAVTKVDPAAAVGMLAERTVIDVRTSAEYAEGHVTGALNIDVEADSFDSQIAALPKDDPYLVYCHSGRRSALAAERLAAAGFTDIVDGGGLGALVAAGATTQVASVPSP
jgi:phage shock protein E